VISRLKSIALLLVLAGMVATISACGEEEELHVVEGEPLELGELSYNVQITRFLNPGDPEDQGYLTDQEPPPANQAYLGVFLTIENEGSEAAEIPDGIRVLDTAGDEYEPVSSESPFALPLPGEGGTTGAEGVVPADEDETSVEPGGEIPEPDTIPAYGPIGGSMLLFRVDETVTENRPLELEIPGESGETGKIELDI
jgi:hypothetical protein